MTQRTGVNRWLWGYLCVLLAAPIGMLPCVCLLLLGLGLDVHPKYGAIFALTMPMVVAYIMVRIYYWRQDARRKLLESEHTK
jgi:Na+-driven multidrug efflux pump